MGDFVRPDEPPTAGRVLVKTSLGDFEVELWTQQAPMACKNFVTLCLEDYYDDVIFHRVVKKFMAQTGDPSGTGNGGESIYNGKPFRDEIHQRLNFVRPGLLAMASKDNQKNSNGSQFFITLGACGWLNKQHTIFGKVTGDSVYNLHKFDGVEVSEDGRPTAPEPKIISTKVLDNPFTDLKPRKSRHEIEEEKRRKEAKKEAKRKKKERKHLDKKDTRLVSFGVEEDEDPVDFSVNLTNHALQPSDDKRAAVSSSSSSAQIPSMTSAKPESPTGRTELESVAQADADADLVKHDENRRHGKGERKERKEKKEKREKRPKDRSESSMRKSKSTKRDRDRDHSNDDEISEDQDKRRHRRKSDRHRSRGSSNGSEDENEERRHRKSDRRESSKRDHDDSSKDRKKHKRHKSSLSKEESSNRDKHRRESNRPSSSSSSSAAAPKKELDEMEKLREELRNKSKHGHSSSKSEIVQESTMSAFEQRRAKYMNNKTLAGNSKSHQKSTLAKLKEFQAKLATTKAGASGKTSSSSSSSSDVADRECGGTPILDVAKTEENYKGGIGENRMEDDDLPDANSNAWMHTELRFRSHIDDAFRIAKKGSDNAGRRGVSEETSEEAELTIIDSKTASGRADFDQLEKERNRGPVKR